MLRTSEFWMAVIMALGQAGAMFGFWKQDDFNTVLYPALVYIVGRVTSKVAKAVVPTVILCLTALLIASVANAQIETSSVFDVKNRTQVAVDVGAMQFAEQETGLEVWRGASAGGALIYSLHQRLSLVGRYDHGFPVDGIRDHRNVMQAFGNLKIYPLPGEDSAVSMSLGAGGLWIDPNDDDRWSGLAGRLNVSRIFRDGWAVLGTYAHGFQEKNDRPKINMLKVALQHRLAGAK
jgi:hypothetical protein